MIARLLIVLAAFGGARLAQQAVRVKIDGGPDPKIDLPAQLYRPAVTPAPAVAIFHGCGGVGANNTRMAELLKSWGYVALVVDSFTSAALRTCAAATGHRRPTPTARHRHRRHRAMARAPDFIAPVRATPSWLFLRGGVGLLRALGPRTELPRAGGWRAAILVYPDCGWARQWVPRSGRACPPCSPWQRSTTGRR
jgi:hypothetical protein